MDDSAGPVLGHRRSRAWTKVGHGLFRPATDEAGRGDLLAWQLVLPESGAFTHLTAAREYGWWLPPLPDALPIFAAIARSDNRPRRAGLRVTRHPRPIGTEVIDGLRLAEPAEVLLSCARELGLLDMVVLVDAAFHQGSCTQPDIDALLSESRRIGGPMLRAASKLADGRSESAWETLLRRLHEVCDVPVEPQLVLAGETGGFVARGDLWITGTTTLHEYDGGEHRKKARHRKDLARERRIGNVVWTRRGYTSNEVLHQGVSILRDADLSLGREHRPERIRAWHALLAESMFTPAGMAHVCRRWGIDPTVGGQESQSPGA